MIYKITTIETIQKTFIVPALTLDAALEQLDESTIDSEKSLDWRVDSAAPHDAPGPYDVEDEIWK